jgi:hypothetical protein
MVRRRQASTGGRAAGGDDFLFMGRIALYGADKESDEVQSSLQLGHDVGALCIHGFLAGNEGIIGENGRKT